MLDLPTYMFGKRNDNDEQQVYKKSRGKNNMPHMTRERNHTRKWFYLTKPNENAWSVHIFIWFDAMCGCICVKNNLIEKKERKKDSEIQADTILLTFLYNLRSIIQVFGHKFSVFSTFCVLLFFFYRRMYEQKERRNVRKRKNKWNKIKY